MTKFQELLTDIEQRIAKRVIRARGGLLAALEREHHALDCLMLAVLDGARDHQDADTLHARQRLFSRLNVGLRSHARAEEQALYELMRHKEVARGSAEHCAASHRQIDQLLRRLETIGEGEIAWLPTLATLQMKTAEHVKEEEEVLFSLASQVLGDAVLMVLEASYLSERLRLEATRGMPPRKRLDAFA